MSSPITALTAQFASLACDTKSISIAALEEYLAGKNVDTHISFLEEVLADEKPKKFYGFQQEDMLANMLFFVMHYFHTEEEKYLHHFLACVPYYFSILESVKKEVPDLDLDDSTDAINEKDPNASELLRMRASNLVAGKTEKLTDYEIAMHQLRRFVAAFIKERREEFFAICAEGFVNWTRIQHPENANTIEVFTFYAYCLGNERVKFLNSICKHNIDNYLRALLTVEATKIEPLLERAIHG